MTMQDLIHLARPRSWPYNNGTNDPLTVATSSIKWATFYKITQEISIVYLFKETRTVYFPGIFSTAELPTTFKGYLS